MQDLFAQLEPTQPRNIAMAPGAMLLRGYLIDAAPALNDSLHNNLHDALGAVIARAPFRHMVTPGGYTMSVAMSNCGALGWISDHKNYRYSATDPLSGLAWPAMPNCFMQLAKQAAAAAGYADFTPDACLINRYVPGTKLSLHQDKDEQSTLHPIVSVSLGLPAVFQFGGLKRSDPISKYQLDHGDIVVWGGASRLNYHGILTLKPGQHPEYGATRINLTFRKAG